MPRVTVVPSDRLIILDGTALVFDYPAPKNLHALQWQGEPETGSGHLEFSDDYNMMLAPRLFAEEVQPFIDLWHAEKERLDKEARAVEKARLAEYNSEPSKFARLRLERDRRVADTDYLVMPDYPLGEEERAKVKAYRQALRDLPAQEGAPWDGGGELTPWPATPNAAALMAGMQV